MQYVRIVARVTSVPGPRRPASNTDADLASLASDLRIVIGRMIRRLRAEYRYGPTQMAVLGRLDREGPLSTSQLANAEHVRPQSMSQTVAELGADGLVIRTQDAQDGRRILVSLSDKGREELEANRVSREGWLAQALADELTDDERACLARSIDLLERLSAR